MRLLITGAGGLLGLNLALRAAGEHKVIGVDRGALSAVPFDVERLDLLQPRAFSDLVARSKPEAVIHCAAIADVDQCERQPEQAQFMNADLPKRIASECVRRAIRLIHISTDAVFDGEKTTAYVESDPPNPKSVYAATKLEGEKAVLQADPSAIVVRVNFYGWSASGRRSLAEFFVRNLSQGVAVKGFTDVTFCPMFVGDLGVILLKMLVMQLHGLYHLVGPQPMTKYAFGLAIARKFGLPEDLISPESVQDSELVARRSHNLHLSVHKLSTALATKLPDFSTGLQEFYEQYQQGYPRKIQGYQQLSRPETAGESATRADS